MLLSLRPKFRGGRHDAGRRSSLLCWPGRKTVLHTPPLAERDTKRREVRGGKRGKETGEAEKVHSFGTHSCLLLSSWQTSYLTQLITHLITVSA